MLIDLQKNNITHSILNTNDLSYLHEEPVDPLHQKFLGGLYNWSNVEKLEDMNDKGYPERMIIETNLKKDTPTIFEHWYANRFHDASPTTMVRNPVSRSNTKQKAHLKLMMGDISKTIKLVRFSGIAKDFDDQDTWQLHSHYSGKTLKPSVVLIPASNSSHFQIAGIRIFHDHGEIYNSVSPQHSVIATDLKIELNHPVVQSVDVAFNELWEDGVWKSTDLFKMTLILNTTVMSPIEKFTPKNSPTMVEELEAWMMKYAKSGLDVFNGNLLNDPAEDFHLMSAFSKYKKTSNRTGNMVFSIV